MAATLAMVAAYTAPCAALLVVLGDRHLRVVKSEIVEAESENVEPPSMEERMGAHSSQNNRHYIDVDLWDYDACPLTQPSLHIQLNEACGEYRGAAHAAPASPPEAVVAQQLEPIASPFVMARSSPAYEQQP